MTGAVRRGIADRRGGVAMMAAGAAALLCLSAAVAVDAGSVALRGRQLQAAADLAAMAGAMRLGQAEAAARATAEANAPIDVAMVRTGTYDPDRAVAPAQRFRPGGVDPNAVEVVVGGEARLVFGRWILGRDGVTLSRRAVAARPRTSPRAMFSIGSRLARLDAGLANAILGALAGGSVSLDVMDYRALADARIGLTPFLDALALELGVTAGDYDGLLERSVNAGRALAAIERVAGPQAGAPLSVLSRAAAGRTLRVSDLIGVETGTGDALAGATGATVSALDLAGAVLEIGGGERQAGLDLGARPGLAELHAVVAVGERPRGAPWITLTDRGSPIVRTTQARVYLTARTRQALAGLAPLDVPILVELAASEARLEAIDCPPAAPDPRVVLGVRPGVARAWIGEVDASALHDFGRAPSPRPARLLSVAGVARVSASAEIEAADPAFRPEPFSRRQIDAAEVRTVGSRAFASGLATSLLSRARIDVEALGLGLGAQGLGPAAEAMLRPLGPVLDEALTPILDALGLKLGQADVRVHAVVCPNDDRPPSLVG